LDARKTPVRRHETFIPINTPSHSWVRSSPILGWGVFAGVYRLFVNLFTFRKGQLP
jgi:hypothetical protein